MGGVNETDGWANLLIEHRLEFTLREWLANLESGEGEEHLRSKIELGTESPIQKN